MSSDIEKIKHFRKSCENFFKFYVQNFNQENQIQNFHKFRLHFLNLLTEV